MSDDGTAEILANHSNITVIEQKCARGKGRQIAIEKAKNDVIVMLDADVEYSNLDWLLDQYEKSGNTEMLWNAVTPTGAGTIPVVIVKRDLIIRIGGYPDINAAEDSYIRLLSEKLGIYYRIKVPIGYFTPLSVRGFSSGEESRYTKSVLGRLVRRILFTRDTLFVHDYSLRELLAFYKLKGMGGWLIGFVEYVVGKFFLLFMSEESVSSRTHRLMNMSNDLRK